MTQSHSDYVPYSSRATDVSSISKGSLVGLLVGSTLGVISILTGVWVFLRYRKRALLKMRKLKKRFQIIVGLVVAGIYLFGPSLFQSHRQDAEPDLEAGNEGLGSITVLIERQGQSGA
jgi:hypothetical protein